MDGRNSLEDIRNILESERMDEFMFDEYFGTGSLATPPAYPSVRIDRKRMLEFVQLCERVGLVRSKARGLTSTP